MELIFRYHALASQERIALVAFLIVLMIGILSLFIFSIIHRRVKKSSVGADKLASLFTPQFMRDYFYFLIHPIYVSLIRMNLKPDSVSILSAMIGLMAAVLAAMGFFFWSGMSLLLSGMFDTIDGKIARERRLESRAGAFFDSVLDRYVDFALYGGFLIYFLHQNRQSGILGVSITLSIILIFMGSALISYVKERGAVLGVIDNRGIMQRGDRMVFLCTAMIYDPVFALFENIWSGNNLNSHYGLIIVLLFVGCTLQISVLLKVIRIRQNLIKQGG